MCVISRAQLKHCHCAQKICAHDASTVYEPDAGAEQPYTSCTRNLDCPGTDNKCKGIPTDKSWGLFEVQLPLKVPAACWNYGTDTKTHERCDDVVPRGPNNPGAMLRLSMLAAPTSNGPVWELTSAKAP